MYDQPSPPDDPLELEAVDRAIRDNELAERAQELGLSSGEINPDCPPEIREQFLNNVAEYDSAPISSRFHQLTSEGVALLPPAALDDAALSTKLWEVIHALAARDAYLYHTDHLSDRQLYEHLWTDTLREQNPIFPPGSGWTNHIDLIGGGSEEDIEIGLRFYDSEEDRAFWARDFPSMIIPPREHPPFDRDRLLPQPPPQAPSLELEEDGFDDEFGDNARDA